MNVTLDSHPPVSHIQKSKTTLKLTKGSVHVPLKIVEQDSSFSGQIHIGKPAQTVNLIFDTGSEYLGVTSNLCSDSTAENFNFKKWDPVANKFQPREKLEGRCHSSAYD